MQGLIRKQINGIKAGRGCRGSARGAHGQGQPAPGLVGGCPGNHADAVDDRAHAETQGAARAAVTHRGQVGFGIKLDRLQAGINIIDGTHGKGQSCSHPVLQHLETPRWDSALQLWQLLHWQGTKQPLSRHWN